MHRTVNSVTVYVLPVIFFSRRHDIRWLLFPGRRWTDIITGEFIATINHVIIFVVSWGIRFVEIAFFIILSVRWRWWRTVSFPLAKLQIIFIESTTYIRSLFPWTTSTAVYTANTFLFRGAVHFYLSPHFLFALFTYIGKPKYISVGIEKSEGRVLFIVEKLYLQNFSI